jgi:hypothetical protein
VALQFRHWNVPQGADTENALRYGTKTGDDPTEYPDLSDGWSARAQMRKKAGDPVWVEFLSSSLSGPRISLEADGYFTVILPASETEQEEWNSRKANPPGTSGVYDVELVSPTGRVIRHTSGTVTVSPDVTRGA